MIWLWIVIFLVIALVIAIGASYIRVEFLFSRMEENDQLYVDVRALFGWIKYRWAVPVIDYKNLSKGVLIHSKTINANKDKALDKSKEHITKDEVINYYEKIKLLLQNTFNLYGWLRNTLQYVECTKLKWITKAGIGDAPETAILTGLIWGLKSSILGFTMGHIRMKNKAIIEVVPQYNQSQFSTYCSSDIRIRVIFILWAGIQLVFRIMKVKGGLRKWIRVFFQA